MKQEVLKNFDISWIPIAGLLIFVLCFALYTFYTFHKKNKAYYESAAKIPLDDSTNLYLKEERN